MPDIKTKTNNWGVAALHRGQRLEFSGVFDAGRFWRDNWNIFFSRLIMRPHGKPVGPVVDIYGLFSHNAREAWSEAAALAKSSRRNVSLEDVFLALLDQPAVANLFARLNASIPATKTLLNNYMLLQASDDQQELLKLPFEAYLLALKLHDGKIGSLMLLGALLNITPKDNILQAIFSNISLTIGKLELLTVWLIDLNFDFPKNSLSQTLLHCCRQTAALEAHFGYYYQFPAIEAAVEMASDRQRASSALGLLVRAGLLAKQQKTRIISASLIKKSVTN